MTDFFLRIGLSNACFSLALAIVAMVVGAKTKRPHLTHLLWLLVFVKLVTPPIVTIPVVRIPGQPQTTIAIKDHSQQVELTSNREFDVGEQPDASLSARIRSVMLNQGRTWLPPIWLLGSVVVFAWSLLQVYRFGRLLGMETEAPPGDLQAAAAKIARRLGLHTIPTICTTSARLSPMVWWAGGKVRVIISTTLLGQMDSHQWQWILAHELAHVRRRDYLVRWLEWFACVCFWWNPVMWWARHNLRANEELCCDALVVSSLNPKPRAYADSLLQAVECLAYPAIRPPATASEVNSGGFLERRFKMIVSKSSSRVNSPRLQALVLLFAMVVLPLGIASAQDYEAVAKRLKKSVGKGEITQQHAKAMMLALTKHDAKAKKDTGYKASGERPKAAVKAGKLTEQKAKAKTPVIKKAKMVAGKKDTGYKTSGERPKAAVKAGKLTEQKASAKMPAIKKKVSAKTKAGDQGKKANADTHLKQVRAKPRAEVAAGKVSPEEAKARMTATKKKGGPKTKAGDGEGKQKVGGK